MGSLVWQGLGWIALACFPHHWPLIVALLFADHVVIAAAGFVPRSGWLGPNQDRLPDEAAARGEIALTFDDGPDPEVTPLVLERLERAGVRASFFCIGSRAERAPALVQRMAAHGHLVENHSYAHSNGFSMLPPWALRRELQRTQEILGRLSGRAPQLFRAPAGFRSLLLEPVLRREGLRLASWSRRGYDTVDRDAARIARRLLRGLAPGDVLLFHDGNPARDRNGKPVVLAVLDQALAACAERQLHPVPLEPAGARAESPA